MRVKKNQGSYPSGLRSSSRTDKSHKSSREGDGHEEEPTRLEKKENEGEDVKVRM